MWKLCWKSYVTSNTLDQALESQYNSEQKKNKRSKREGREVLLMRRKVMQREVVSERASS